MIVDKVLMIVFDLSFLDFLDHVFMTNSWQYAAGVRSQLLKT